MVQKQTSTAAPPASAARLPWQKARVVAERHYRAGREPEEIALRLAYSPETVRRWVVSLGWTRPPMPKRLAEALATEAGRVALAVDAGDCGETERAAKAFTALARASQALGEMGEVAPSALPLETWEDADADRLRAELERRLARLAAPGTAEAVSGEPD
jgi:hypothetical protein